ncbi:MAG TPA: protease pro-enzyme activation domain-containing protein, partial [Acidimicrobiales bacterium]|nr:protease pro-enzyme activation domain-containing protein [Acidimicrobiales bacterium]
MSVRGVSPNHLLVSFRGSAAQVDRAFHTSLSSFRLPDGTIGRATTTPVELPSSIASDVRVVAGLDSLVTFHSLGLHRSGLGHRAARATAAPSVAGGPTACGAASADAAVNGGLTDSQIASAYGAFGLYRQGDTGAGESVAIFELEPFARSDISTFDTCYFGAHAAAAMAGRLHVTAVDGGEPSGFGSGEALLDVEDVSALAPGARIDVYEAPNSTYGSIDDYNQIVSADADQVVSTSWGLCETALQQGAPGQLQEENAIFQEAAAQGQTVVAAAGDDGSDDCNSFYSLSPVKPVLSVDDPGSQPYVVSAGGSTIDDATQPPVEQVWNDGIKGGAGGGGISNTWVMPSWQSASHVPGIAPSSALATAAH